MRIKKDILFYLFTFIFFITPNLPMPTSRLGPIGPALYILILVVFFALKSKVKSVVYYNTYFKIMLVLTLFLLISDFLKVLLFDFKYELNFILVRILNFGIFFLYGQMLVEEDTQNSNYVISPYYFKVYIYSIIFISIILYGQAFGFIKFGEVFTARTFFGIKLPFNKPVGLLELSDGKLGIIIAPAIFLLLLCGVKKYKLTQIRWPFLLAFILFTLLIIMQSRSAYLGAAVALVVFVSLYPSNKVRAYFFGAGLLSLIGLVFSGVYKIIWFGLVGEGIYERNVDARGNVLQHAWETFLTSPLYGVGHKNLILYDNPFASHGVGVHNLFADHLGSGGLIAFVPFALIFIIFLYFNTKSYFRSLRDGNDKQLALVIWLITSMVYIIIELFFYRGFYNEYLYLFLAFGTISYLNLHKSFKLNSPK